MSSKTIRRLRLAGSRAFTLVELMVAMVAGLIVALAVVALSKEATNTFHETARTATAEMSLRTAAERLRNDLMRAGYMSSANIQLDPTIAHAPGAPNVPDNSTFVGLARLAGIRLIYQGSLLATPLSALNDNSNLAPDAIEISGNFTSTEAFVVRSLDAGGACNGQRLTLEMDSPAMWRVRSTPSPDDTLRSIFQPIAGGQFLVRVEDDTGHFQYIPTCSGAATAQVTISGGVGNAYVDVINQGNFRILSSKDTQANGGASGLGVGRLLVNPVQTVRWEIRPLDSSKPGDLAFSPLIAADAGSGTKYDLFRTYVDVTGTKLSQTELVAEYAVDLKFGFSADLTAQNVSPRLLTVYGLSDARNQGLADTVLLSTSSPQRIRSVRFRMSTRAAVADMSAGLTAPAANAQQPAYPLRYCTVAGGCTIGQSGWARMRTITTEVALPNQAKVFY